MMGAAENSQRVGIVTAALGAKHDVVDVDESTLCTPRNDAPPSVASQDETAHSRWHVLRCPHRSRAHVGVDGRWLGAPLLDFMASSSHSLFSATDSGSSHRRDGSTEP
jgi:hypothetical protein